MSSRRFATMSFLLLLSQAVYSEEATCFSQELRHTRSVELRTLIDATAADLLNQNCDLSKTFSVSYNLAGGVSWPAVHVCCLKKN